ncbi:solute carrier family 26 member 10-like isoform X2 [Pomacea canaliculata]|uniref:solute carrier family 26 member 10-like isoform X2 n=1 Tax=Pomacea canaliculata TaxID=400727 RepID=UPI000D73746E|nr:solute carrier family 26 member 10-like isoform X2 [Pomacea canaliculata]
MASELYPCMPEDLQTEEPEFRISLFELSTSTEAAKRVIRKRLRRKKARMKMTRNSILKQSLRKMKETCQSCACSWTCARTYLRRFFPFVSILNGYSALYDLPCDLIAGLTVGIMHIPQGMAYAMLARLPPVYGLYTSFYPVLLYFFFGTSRHISVGTFAVVSLMIGAVVDEGQMAWGGQRQQQPPPLSAALNVSSSLYNSNVSRSDLPGVGVGSAGGQPLAFDGGKSELEAIKVSYAMSATFAVGVLQIFLGMVRLGFLTTFLSDPLISGFTTGAAVHVMSSQLHSIFGIPVGQYSGAFKLIYGYRDFFGNLDQINYVTLTASVSAMLVLVLIRDGINNNKKHFPCMRVPIPIELLVIIGAALLSYYLHLHEAFNVEVIGHIPRGLPSVDLTVLRFLPNVMGKSLAICLTAFALSFAIAKILADKHDYVVDPNQELFAHGMTNIVGSLCSSYCSSASLSRSVVQEEVGAKTQIASLISAVLILFVLLVIGPLFKPLPNCILAAIIVVSLKKLFLQFSELRRLWKVSKLDFTVWIVVFLSTVLFDVDLGLLIGLIYNLVPILLRTQRPYVCTMGHIRGTEVYADVRVHREAQEIAGIKIFRFEAPLYFGNVDHFRRSLAAETGLDPKELKIVHKVIKETDLSLHHEQVCLGSTQGVTKSCCDDHKNLRDLRTPSPSSGIYAIVIDGSTFQYIDSVTARVLREVIKEYEAVGIGVFLGECKPAVRAMLEKSGFYVHVERRNVCATIHHAVVLAQQTALSSSLESVLPAEDGASSSFVRLNLVSTEDEHHSH